MTFFRQHWWIAALLSVIALALPFILTYGPEEIKHDNPRAKMKNTMILGGVDHSSLLKGPFTDGPSVTKACLECHPNAAKDVMKTTHWTWESDSVSRKGHEAKVTLGKKHGFNNFCVAVSGGNWPRCTVCHVGYGWKDKKFDFNKEENVDCLVCHDQSGKYKKWLGGIPDTAKTDFVAAAQSVGRPTRKNCGGCHFNGGGGDAVKHGDIDQSLMNPSSEVDVHMGKHKMECVDCHTTSHHQIKGRAMSVNNGTKNRLSCTECHSQTPHGDDRLDRHTQAISCQTCHIPNVAVKTATKVDWDWSQAGDATRKKDKHKYIKKKGAFIYKRNLQPEYYWYNGNSDIYVQGDKIDTTQIVQINAPHGSKEDATAKIHPFKVHRGKQIFDKVHMHLLPPKVFGKGGYWKTFDWDNAARIGAKTAGIEYSGEFGFVATEMYWPLDHMVATKEKALQCSDCHGDANRMDWKALGYTGDPMVTRNTREAK
jgi:octaheme c-type cytochrome (tetrathionate reductase family)